jgi:hypothetical protein
MKSNTRISSVAAIASCVLLFASVGTSWATLVEGFESGAFSGTEATKGDASISSPSFGGINPTQGTHQLVLTTINSSGPDGAAGYSSVSGTNAVPVAGIGTGLAAFFGVTTSSIHDSSTGANGQEGSGFTINLGVLTAGTQISFDYDFLTQEPPNGNKDFAFYTLNNGVTSSFGGGISNVNAATLATPGSNIFGSQTGYKTFTISITTTATYTLGLGVVDAGNSASDDAPSALLVDNIQIVPEPTTIAFGIAGASLLVALRSRFKKS